MFIRQATSNFKFLSRGATSSQLKLCERLNNIRKLAKIFKKLSVEYRENELLGLFYYFEQSSIYSEKWFASQNNILIPRGLALHIPSSNIPLMAIYSWLPSYIAGNANYIRLSRRSDYNLLELVITNIDNVIGEEESHNQIFYNGELDDCFTTNLSKIIDIRILWGSDNSIKSIKQKYPNSSSIEISFRNRYSASLLNSKNYLYLSEDNKNIITKKYFRDSLDFSFNACSSPHYTFWMGEHKINIKANNDFKDKIKRLISLQSIEYGFITSSNLNKSQEYIINNNTKIDIQEIIGGRSFTYDDIKNITLEEQNTSSIFWKHYSTSNIKELSSYFPKNIQTLTYLNSHSKENLKELILMLEGNAPERIVEVGNALSFNFVWDGNDLLRMFSKEVFIQ